MDNVMFNVNPTFNMDAFAAQLASMYQAKGYNVAVTNLNGSVSINFEKGLGGINTLLGLGVGIRANVMINNGTLVVNFSDAEWTSKIIGLVVGWFLCLIPFITGIVGVTRQLNLPKDIGNDVRMIASTM